jgi:parallel beta-helix repeat protein
MPQRPHHKSLHNLHGSTDQAIGRARAGSIGQSRGQSASQSETIALWRGKLLVLAMGMSAVVLLADRNAKAMAQTRPAHRETPELAQRPVPATPQTVIWVNPSGNDAKADGSEQAPFRTITQALQSARANTVIQLAAGTYSTDSGEVFPLALKSGVTIQGNPEELGQGTVIRGGGSYSSASLGQQNATVIGASQAMIAGVTITNPTLRGHGIWVETGSPTVRNNTLISSTNAGMVAAGSSAPVIQNNLFVLNRIGGVVVTGYAQPQVRDNLFQRTGSGIAVGENAAPQIVGNRLSQNRNGIVVQGNSSPILRSNTIEDSERDGLVVIAQAQPNLGTAQDPGQNSFYHNRHHDIDALATTQTLPAFGNQFVSTAGQIDLTGKAPLVSVTTVASAADHLPATQVSPVPALPLTPIRSLPSPQSATRLAPQAALIASLPPGLNAVNSASTTVSTTDSAAYLAAGLRPVNTQSSTVRALATQVLPTRAPVSQVAVVPQSSHQTNDQINQAIASSLTSSPANLPASSLTSQSSNQSTRQPAAISVAPPVQAPLGSPPIQASPVQATSATLSNTASNTASSTALGNPASSNAALGNVVVLASASLPRQNSTELTAPTISGAPINVPAPASTPASTAPVPTPAAPSVPMPRPMSSVSVPSVQMRSAPISPVSTATIAARPSTQSSGNLLPVPAEEIPIGNIGDMDRISISEAQSGGTLMAMGTVPQNLQYRVFVAADDEAGQALVRSVIPDAFSTWLDGQSVMQIGAFGSYDNAQEAVALLSRNGLQGIIQPME